MAKSGHGKMSDPSKIANLSERQREILRLVARHMQAKEVARLLKISESTVKTHTEEARRRLGVSTTREAARLLVAAETPLPIDGGRPSMPMAAYSADAHAADHEQTVSSRQRLPDNILGGSGDGLVNVGLAGQASSDQTGDIDFERAEPHIGAGKDRLHNGLGNSLVVGRLYLLRQWLRSLSFIQWFVLVACMSIASALIAGGLLISIIGVMEGFQQINNRTG